MGICRGHAGVNGGAAVCGSAEDSSVLDLQGAGGCKGVALRPQVAFGVGGMMLGMPRLGPPTHAAGQQQLPTNLLLLVGSSTTFTTSRVTRTRACPPPAECPHGRPAPRCQSALSPGWAAAAPGLQAGGGRASDEACGTCCLVPTRLAEGWPTRPARPHWSSQQGGWGGGGARRLQSATPPARAAGRGCRLPGRWLAAPGGAHRLGRGGPQTARPAGGSA